MTSRPSYGSPGAGFPGGKLTADLFASRAPVDGSIKLGTFAKTYAAQY
ncbi:hypothetical protein [Chitinophaga agri]|uniref:Uncharacterized protein n=1 Tax=Chitinophaga agri TaxID=2703787 RepID=A0A6B9ZBI3_9BACT|nr:hypothetical protein [Chitinophaga agri]QHS59658.1 hypothetical protein GWR21_08650 [Chitinophaga agri]